jgi:hypothetical protein
MRFAPRFDVLPRPQQRVWPELKSVAQGTVLYGETAVALHLGHRTSVDFDFFTSKALEADRCLAQLSTLGELVVLQATQNTVTVLVDRDGPVKLSLFGGIHTGRLAPPLTTEDGVMRVASRRDLLAHKLKTVYQRVEAKDYLDLAALIGSGGSLREGLAGALAFWRDLPVQDVLRALCYFHEGDFSSLGDDARRVLAAAAQTANLAGLKAAALHHPHLEAEPTDV